MEKKTDKGMDRKNDRNRREARGCGEKRQVLSCVLVYVLPGIGRAGRLTYHSIIPQNYLRGSFPFQSVFQEEGRSLGEKNAFISPLLPADCSPFPLLFAKRCAIAILLSVKCDLSN